MAGNKLGKAYSFPGLQQRRGVDYDPNRDLAALQAAFRGELVQLPQQELQTEVAVVDDIQPDYTGYAISAEETSSADGKVLKTSLPGALFASTQTSHSDEAEDISFQEDVFITPTSETLPQERESLTPPQPNYAAVIAPTICLLWEHLGQCSYFEGRHYELYRVEQTLRLQRKGGDAITSIPLADGAEAQDLGLTTVDLQRLEQLRQHLEVENGQQQDVTKRQQGWDRER